MFGWAGMRRAGPIGIDLGTQSLKMVQFSADHKELIAAVRQELPAPPRGGDEPASAEAIPELIRRGLSQRPFVGRDAVLCLTGKQVALHNVRVPASHGADFERKVVQETSGRLGFAADEAEIQYIESAEVRQGEAVLREVIVFACHRPVLQRSIAAIEQAALTPVGVDVEPAALVRSYAHQHRREEDQKARALVVHVGHERSVALIAQGEELLFAKYIDVGGSQFDAAAAQHLGMEVAQAAALRRQSGERRADLQDPEVVRSLSEGMRPVIERLVSELSLCIRYYSVTFRGQPLTNLIVGGGEATEPLAETLGKHLHLTFALSDPFRGITAPREAVRRGAWDLAAGLALREAI